MIRVVNISLNAAHPELPLCEAATFALAPSAVFIRGVPRRVGAWEITAVRVAATYPDGVVETRRAVESPGGVWTATIPGGAVAGRTDAGLRIYADGIDENGAAVTGYVLGFADLSVRTLSAAPVPEPGASSFEMWFFEERPENPRAGYVYAEADGTLMLYNGSAWVDFGGGGTSDYSDLANKPSINDVTLAGNKTAANLGLATAAQGAKADMAYQKPQNGIPASDMAQEVRASLNKANTALQNAPVASVNGKTGVVALTASDVGAKPTQTPVPDPDAYYAADEFISNIRQDKNGVIKPEKKKVDFTKVATHALPFSLPEEFYPVDVWVAGAGGDLYVTIHDPSLLTVVPNETGGGPYMLQYYNPDPDAEDDLRGYIGLAVFDNNLEFDRYGQAATLDFGGHNPLVDTVYLVAGGGGLSLLGTLVQPRLGYIPLDAEAVADAYDATSTYSVGDTVTYDGRLYECNTAISSPEAWDATHWTEKKIGAGGNFSPLSGRNFDFATTQGVMDALKATIEALGGTVTNAPTTPVQNNQTQGE